MKKSFLISLLILSPNFALGSPQNGFDTQDLQNAAKLAAVDISTKNSRIAFAQTEKLRALIVQDAAKAWARLSPAERQIMESAFNTGEAQNDLAMLWFMRSSISQSSIFDGGKFSAIYNPLSDVWLLILWNNKNNKWRIADATLVKGSNEASWEDAKTDYFEAIKNGFFGARELFSNLIHEKMPQTIMKQSAPKSDEARDIALLLIKRQLATLGPIYSDAKTAKMIGSVESRIFLAQSQDEFLKNIPIKVRRTFAPISVLNTKSGKSILFCSPIYPEILIGANFKNAQMNSEPELKLVNLRGEITDNSSMEK